jgi:hypothetical protein
MTQNIISLSFTDADLTTIDEALALLEQKLAALIGLSPEERRGLVKMGDRSEAFCRETLMVLAQNTHLLPPSFELADAQNDLAHLDKLRPRTARLRRLLEKADDGETALGSDVMSAALEGYAMLKVSGKGAGLDALREGMSARFTRKAKIKALPAAGLARSSLRFFLYLFDYSGKGGTMWCIVYPCLWKLMMLTVRGSYAIIGGHVHRHRPQPQLSARRPLA